MNRRRTLLTALSGSALPAPFAALAQQPVAPAGATGKVWRIGVLALPARPASFDTHIYGGTLRGLRDLGYVEGKNLVIEWRFADSDVKRLPELAAELVRMKPDILLCAGDNASQAMQQATTTIPIVSAGTSDPIAIGLIKSLARPGGNITGVTNQTRGQLWALKHIQDAGLSVGITIVPIYAGTVAALVQAILHRILEGNQYEPSSQTRDCPWRQRIDGTVRRVGSTSAQTAGGNGGICRVQSLAHRRP